MEERKTYTMNELSEIYFQQEFDDLLPFRDFIEYIKNMGYEIEDGDGNECK